MITVWDDVLVNPATYRTAALSLPFADVEAGSSTFHRMAPAPSPELTLWVVSHYPQLQPGLTFVRQSPEGQREPNYIHTDQEMGDWTAILYLNPQPMKGDGTTFWKHKLTGKILSEAVSVMEQAEECLEWLDLERWEPWMTVEARFNRIVLFPSGCFHSRAIEANYGQGDDARLIQVMFGTGAMSSWP